MEIATIGFAQSSAEHFFSRLKVAGVRRLVDTRLHNASQLAGFSKAPDLEFFLREVAGIAYEHNTKLAPSEELLAAYRNKKLPWEEYERAFLRLLADRQVPAILDRRQFATKTALLCSEALPDKCHRRLVAELLAREWGAEIEHL